MLPPSRPRWLASGANDARRAPGTVGRVRPGAAAVGERAHLVGGGGRRYQSVEPADRCLSGCVLDPGQDHHEGTRHDAGGGRGARSGADRTGNAGYPRAAHVALGIQIRHCRCHIGFSRWRRCLLGAPAGVRAAGECVARSACGRDWRHGTDHHAAGRDADVHHRGRGLAGAKAWRAGLGDTSGAAHLARGGRCQCAGWHGAQLRGGAGRRSADGAWHQPAAVAHGYRGQ